MKPEASVAASDHSMTDKFAALRLRIKVNLETQKAKKSLKAKVESARDLPLFGQELKRANADAKRLAALHAEDQWTTTSVLITGQHQYCCGCGHDALATTGVYSVQRHKTFNAQRLKATLTPDLSLPVMKAIDPQDLVVKICAACALDGDDPIVSLLEVAAHTAPFATSQLPLF